MIIPVLPLLEWTRFGGAGHGLGELKGAIIGGVLLGFIEVFASAYIPNGSQYQDVFSFLAVIAFLIFRPSGILGEKIFEKV